MGISFVILFYCNACVIVCYFVEKFHMSFRMGKTQCKLVKSILAAHGFREVSEFRWSVSNSLTSGTHLLLAGTPA